MPRVDSANDGVRAALVSMIESCGIQARGAIYVSTPITTGPDWLEWRIATSGMSPEARSASHRRQIIEPNLQRARHSIELIRATVAEPVIDPTALLDIDGWGQRDYHSLWIEVLRTYANRVIFLDGWMQSWAASGSTWQRLLSESRLSRALASPSKRKQRCGSSLR